MYKVNEKKIFYDTADNRTIVINSETGIYYGINDFSSSVFENIIKGASIPEIFSAINKLPGAPQDMLQRLETFVKELEEKEVIIPGDTVETPVSIDPELAAKADFKLSAVEYADAQEMLLADPIHDVVEYDGWQPDITSKK
jgi:hypothetical protein